MSLPDLFKRQGALASLRPGNIQSLFQGNPPEEECKPQLLQRFEASLQHLSKGSISHTAHNTTWSTGKLQLDAHKQVFDLFISCMTTYKPFLLRIKQAYETALEDAVTSAYDHVKLQLELSAMPHAHADGVAAARQQAEESAAAMLEELQGKLLELEKQAVQAEQEGIDTDEQLRHYLKHILQARKELDQLETSNRRAYKDLVDNSTWQLLALADGMEGSHVGRAYRTSGCMSSL